MKLKLVLVPFTVLLAGSILRLNWTGICYERGRVVSDQEILLDALRFLSRREDFPATGDDEGLGGFIRDNPSCCAVHWENNFIEEWRLKRLLGVAQVAVEVRYRRKVPDREGAYYTVHLALSNCGGTVLESFGMATNTL